RRSAGACARCSADVSARLRIALGQINLLVGDVAGNARKMAAAAGRARDELKAQLVVFPELALTGYPPDDLLLRPELIARAEAGLAELAHAARDIDILAGHPEREDGRLYNAASLLRAGRVHATYRKHHLPNYGVFRSEEHTSELQSREKLVCRLLLENKNNLDLK